MTSLTKPPRFLVLVTVTVKRVTRGVLHSVHVKLPSRQDAQPPVPWSVETHPGLEGATKLQAMLQAQHKEHKRAHSVSTGARTSHRPDETQGVQGQGAAARRSAGFDYRNRVPSDPNRQVSGDRTQDNPPLSETESEPETMTTKCRLLSRDECTVSFNVKEPSPSQPETLWLQVQLELPLHVTELHVAWESPTSRHLRPLCYARGGP